MSRRRLPRLVWLAYALAVVGLLALGAAERARAQDLRATTSLGMAPADAAFYSSQLRLGEQLEALLESKAAARLVELTGQPIERIDSVKDLIERLREGIKPFTADDPSLEMLQGWLEAPENQELLELLADAGSHEMFVYGGSGHTKLWNVYGQFDERWQAEIRRLVKERGDELDFTKQEVYEQVDIDRVVPWEQVSSLEMPETVVGFRLSDAARGRRQLARLMPFLPLLELQVPELAGRLKVVKIGDADFITAELDGSLIDWEEIRKDAAAGAADAGGDDGEIDPKSEAIAKRFIEIAKTKKLTISIGVRGDYLLVSVGPDRAHLEALGKGELLLDRPELARLRKTVVGDDKLVAASYVSNDYARSGRSWEAMVDDFVVAGGAALTDAPRLDEAQKQQVQRDLVELGEDVKRLIPDRGGKLRFVLWTERGYEGWRQSWAENRALDGSRPLSITEHAGGDPLVLVAGRARNTLEDYQTLVKWIKKAHGYFRELGVDELAETERAQYDLFEKEVAPYIARAHALIGEKLLPALRDGQAALVIDAKMKTKLPGLETAEELPLLEPALVWGVSDRVLLELAYTEAIDLVNDIAARIHEAAPDQIPKWRMPAAESLEVADGTLQTFPFPEEAGIDARLAPTAALSDRVVLFAISREHAQRLLKPTPLKVDGPLGEHRGPAAAAVYVNTAGLLEVGRPWIELAIREAAKLPIPNLEDLGVPGAAPEPAFDELEESDADEDAKDGQDEPKADDAEAAEGDSFDAEQAVAAFRTTLGFLKCLRGYSSVTFAEGDSLVTHFEWHFTDLE